MCLQNIIGISAKLRALGPEQRFDNTFWILLMRWRRLLQLNQSNTYRSIPHFMWDLIMGFSQLFFLVTCLNTTDELSKVYKNVLIQGVIKTTISPHFLSIS